MNKIELLEIVKRGEDSFAEFKEEGIHSDKLAAEIVAFANTEGGNLIIGKMVSVHYNSLYSKKLEGDFFNRN